jgi:hypothetical protein
MVRILLPAGRSNLLAVNPGARMATVIATNRTILVAGGGIRAMTAAREAAGGEAREGMNAIVA